MAKRTSTHTRIRRAAYRYLNRTLCDVLDEMRTCVKVANYGPLPSLIEEAQTMGNHMEEGLGIKFDLPKMREERERLRRELKDLDARIPADVMED